MATKQKQKTGNGGLFLVIAAAAGLFYFSKKTSGTTSLAGRVVSGVDGTPVVGAAVLFGSATATSDANGRFTMQTLTPGTYDTIITATGFIVLSQSVTIVAGQNSKVFQMFKTPTQAGLSGRATDVNTGSALSGAMVSVDGKTASTAADGTYSISGLVTGATTVTSTKAGYADQTSSITLVAGANTLNIAMNNRGTIQGTVRDSVTSVPISGASVVSAASTTTNANGGYSLTMASGSKDVTVSKAGYQSQTQNVLVEPEMTKPLDFALVQNFAQEGTVQGTVHNASNNNPVEGAQILFTGPDQVAHEVYSGALGLYSLVLPASSLGINYSIQANASGYQAYVGSQSVRTGTINTKNLPLTPSSVLRGTLDGVVYNRQNTNQVIAGATIRIEGTSPLRTGISNAQGYFNIANVPVGHYTVWCNADGYAQMSKEIEITSGQTSSIGFDMQPVETAIGFFMQVDFDPSNYPTAAVWFSDINGAYYNYFASVNTQWDGSQWDMGQVTVQTLTVELYDSNYALLVRRIVPLGGAAGPLVQNGHVYSFNVDQAKLYDNGPF